MGVILQPPPRRSFDARPELVRVAAGSPFEDARFLMLGMGDHSLQATDSSLYENHGTLVNMDPASDWVLENGRWGLRLDGSDDYAAIPHSSSLNITGKLTLATWVKFSTVDTAYRTLMAKRSGGIASWAIRKSIALGHPSAGSTDTDLTFYHYNSTWRIYHTTGAGLVSGESYQVTATYDGMTDPKIYLNGRLLSGGWATGYEGPAPLVANTTPVLLGAIDDSLPERLAGSLTDSFIWNDVLSPAEIATLASPDPMYGGWLEPDCCNWTPRSVEGSPQPVSRKIRYVYID